MTVCMCVKSDSCNPHLFEGLETRVLPYSSHVLEYSLLHVLLKTTSSQITLIGIQTIICRENFWDLLPRTGF